MDRRKFLWGAGAATALAAAGLGGRYWPEDVSARLPPAGVKDLGSNLVYVRADYRFVDYRIYEHRGYWLRGPAPGPLEPGGYIAFAGAAQTFGRFADSPFPTLVGDALGCPS